MSLTQRAQAQLSTFSPKAGKFYAQWRNYDYGQGHHSAVSGLSPYVRRRILHEREVIARIRTQHSFADSEKFIQEVFWRTYWKGWLEHRPVIWQDYSAGLSADHRAVANDPAAARLYHDVTHGACDIACMNEWSTELRQTGYLHNHARMWFASIWVFTLGLPWRLGAQFFWRNLHDGDAASNTLSWRWVAGLQTVGKHYVATPQNITKFTDGRHHPNALNTHATALNGAPHPAPIPPDLPRVVEHPNRYGLLVHEEDMTTAPYRPEARAILCPPLAPQHHRATHVQTQIDAGLTERAGPDAPRLQTAAQIAAWAQQSALSDIVMRYLPQGPLRDAIDGWGAALAQDGITLHIDTDPYDALCWPYATKGFFAFKKNIPQFLTHLEQT